MSPYNPNSIWTSKENPNLPRKARSEVRPQLKEVAAGPGPDASPSPSQEPHETLIIRPPHKRSFMAQYGLWMFGIGIVVLIGVAVAAVQLFKAPAKPATTVTISPPSSIAVGVPFTVSISAANDSAGTLSGAVIALQLPQGVSFVGDGPATQVKEYPQGNLDAGAVVTQTSTLIVTGNPDTLYALSAKFLFATPQTPSTTYETDQAASFSAGPSPVSLTYSAPTSIVSGQTFPFTVNYVNNGSQPVAGARVTIAYPDGNAYAFATSSLPVATGTYDGTSNAWDLGTLAPGQSGSFTVTGTLVGAAHAQYQLTGTVTTNAGGRDYPMNVQPLNLALVPAPLSLAVALNGTSTYVASAGDSLNYTLTYTNNSSVTMAGVKITAALAGRMFDLASLQTNGSFNSRTGMVTWYAADTPALASVAPGQSGSVSFSINTKSAFPIRLPSDKDYSLRVMGTIASPTVIPGAPGTSTVSVVSATNKVGGAIALAAKGLWQSGPYPPKVDQPTSYTIDWEITNYSTDAANMTVSAYLKSGSAFLGAASSTETTSTPTYDPGTGLVTWTVPFVPAGTGIVDPPMKAEFTVSNTPAVNQVGSDVTLLGQTTLTASDTWTGQPLDAQAGEITTALPNETSLTNGARSVTQ